MSRLRPRSRQEWFEMGAASGVDLEMRGLELGVRVR